MSQGAKFRTGATIVPSEPLSGRRRRYAEPRSVPLLLLDPRHRFARQAVKRLNGEENVVFLGVLDLIVADSPQGLDE